VYQFEAEEIMTASGRRSNSDLLKPEKTGVETDQRGWIRVNKYLETSKLGIWALGDATGKHMFRHIANYEANIVSNNMFEDEKIENDEHAFPYAVFTHPQVAGMGLKEAEALAGGHKILVGRARYICYIISIQYEKPHEDLAKAPAWPCLNFPTRANEARAFPGL
jgi:mycothione reductase